MTRKELRRLQELRETLTMEDAMFACPAHLSAAYPPGNWPAKYAAFTADVQEETRIWRETWVFPILDELIEKYK